MARQRKDAQTANLEPTNDIAGETNSGKTAIEEAREFLAAVKRIDAAAGTRIRWIADGQAEVAEFFGVGPDAVKNWAQQGMPGTRGSYPLNRIAVWLRTEGPKSKLIQAAEDPLLAEGDSPGLERYRMAKAKLAELDLESRKNQLIDREKARDIFGRWATLIRRMGERLSKRWGNEAANMVNETLDECRLIVEESLDDRSGD